MQSLCVICKGRGWCGKPCPILAKLKSFQPKVALEFSGSSPPEIFVGSYGYPKVFTGILAPAELGETSHLSMPEEWHAEKADIVKILSYRSRLIYSRFQSSIKEIRKENRNLVKVMQEVALASKSTSLEFELKKKPQLRIQLDMHMPVIGNPAPLAKARLTQNPYIEKKVDYLTSDTDIKAGQAVQELYKAKISISGLIKILSAGMLGLKMQRKLVPTRWAVTAVDSIISKQIIEKVKFYPKISEFLLFHSDYLGNYYEILLLPGEFSFEVIEAKMPGSVWNPQGMHTFICADHEGYYGRKTYASNCGGGYYAPRLAIAEYLNKMKRQASCLVMRECRPDYWAPCGVGVLRETARDALTKKPEHFGTLKEALTKAQTRFKLKIETFIKKSKLLYEYKTQLKLAQFLK